MRDNPALLLALLLAGLFLIATEFRAPLADSHKSSLDSQVVIAAPIQIIMYGGDRFLGANVEAIRATTITIDSTDANTAYRLRAHDTVAQLNPCHEDNYYLGNAILTWGGSEDAGNELLRRATECRSWDEIPPFFYGFNQYFFYRNHSEAQRILEIAANRSAKNAAAYRKLAIMIAVDEIDDEEIALNYLHGQISQTNDQKLKQMLEKRLERIEGLVLLRQAQKQYEEQYGHKLNDHNALISSGILKKFPDDPLRLGYEFKEDEFRLRTLKIQGIEDRP